MSEFGVRPRFKIKINLPKEEVRKLLNQLLQEQNPSGYYGQMKHGHLILQIPKDKKRFWTPQMDINLIEADEDDQSTVLSCLITPEAAVWTFFMFIYVLSGFGSFTGLIIASSQITLEKEPWGFTLAIISAILGVVFYLIARLGKQLAFEERKSFYLFLRQLPNNKILK